MTDDLDDLFATAAADGRAVLPSDRLVARVLGDAAREQPRFAAKQIIAPVRGGFWSAVSALFGGSSVVAGLGTAAVAGLYLGFAQPPALLQLTEAVIGTSSLESVDLMPGVDALLSED